MQLVTYKTVRFYVAILIAAFLCSCSAKEAQSQAIVSNLKERYGLAVHQLDDVDQLPGSVVFKIKNGEAVVKINPLKEGQFYNYLSVLQEALAKYPQNLIRNALTDIYIGGPYTENNAIIVGMYERTNIFLFYNHKEGNNAPLFLEQSFHHEFSSILITQYDFPAFDWLKLNPEDFSYIINPKKIDEYMNSVGTYVADKAMFEQGLISAYGMVNAENDINTYAELIFTQPDKMKHYINTYPVIAKKYQMIKKFYLSLSPRFKETFSLIDN